VASPTTSFSDYTKKLREEIDAALRDRVRLGAGCPDPLAEAMTYSLLAPGKRLRPLLVLMAAEACGADSRVALPAACAVEMVHAYSLIHDDLPAMDDDDLRRGSPTCHKVFGEAMAILAGDALLTLAFETLASSFQPADSAGEACALLGKAAGATALVGGQAADLLASDDVAHNRDSGEDLCRLEAIHRRKIGAMFLVSLQLGALSAGATNEQCHALETYGCSLGLAFQITDDLLDVQGAEEQLGKRVGKDSQHGKLTFPRLLGVNDSRQRALELVDKACGALELFQHHGAGLEALARFVAERNR